MQLGILPQQIKVNLALAVAGENVLPGIATLGYVVGNIDNLDPRQTSHGPAKYQKTSRLSPSFRKSVGESFVGGAVSGGLAGLTLGASEVPLAATLLVGAGSDMVGGVAERTLRAATGEDVDPTDPASVVVDGVTGLAGAALGRIVSQKIPVPDSLKVGRHASAARKALARAQQKRIGLVNRAKVAVDFAVGTAGSNLLNRGITWLDYIFGTTSFPQDNEQHKKEEKPLQEEVTHTFDYNPL